LYIQTAEKTIAVLRETDTCITVNHSVNFVDCDTLVHTNTI